MNKEIKSTLRKTAKIAGVTCVAAGAIALMTSTAAIMAITEGARYLKDTVMKIAREDSQDEDAVVDAAAEEAEETPAAEEAPAVEAAAEEAPAAESESQEA